MITDSPLLLSLYYGEKFSDHPHLSSHLALGLWHTYDNISILLKRTKQFVKLGRLGDEQNAKEADEGIEQILINNTIDYKIVTDNVNVIDDIMREIWA